MEEGIMHAERALKRMSLSENIWWWKYARDKRRSDYVSEMAARKEALEEARTEGRAEGLAEGRTEGLAESEAKYQPVVEAKDREIEELRRKLRKAGIDD
jgi:flagellar biosynthesis/type III secretory pathway protein FliH